MSIEDENLVSQSDWWTSTKSNPHMFSKPYQTRELRDLLLDRVGIDAAQIAIEAATQHVNRNQVEAFQRKLGLRKLARNDGSVK